MASMENEPKRARRSSVQQSSGGEELEGPQETDINNGTMMVIACVVENRSRETVVAVARSWRALEIYT
jgi:hypothetical protein